MVISRYIRKINGVDLAFYVGNRDRNFFKIGGSLGIDRKELCYWTRALCKLKQVYNNRLHMVLITEKLNDIVHKYDIIDDEKEKEIFREVDKLFDKGEELDELFEKGVLLNQKLERESNSPNDDLLTRYFPYFGNNVYAWMITQTSLYVAGKKMRYRDNISLFKVWAYFEDVIFRFMILWTIIDPDIVDEILAYIECYETYPTVPGGDEYIIYLIQQKIDQIEKRVKDFKEMNSMEERKSNICWACEKEVDEKDLTEVYRPFLVNEKISEIECQQCAKLSDVEYMKKMEEKWNEKINIEYESEIEAEISKEYESEIEAEISKEYETEIGEVCQV